MAKMDKSAGSGAALAELWRGGRMESRHFGHAVICGPDGEVREAWGNPDRTIFPRSSCKMVQALPLMESGAGAALPDRLVALACASHQGARIHVDAVTRWLADMDMTPDNLRCGAHDPYDRSERDRLVRAYEAPCQCHNNCSGKHTGFLMMSRHMGAGPEYIAPDHPLQQAIRQTTEEVAGETSPGYGIDGCSAPNFAMTLTGLGRSMAAFANATGAGDARDRAMHRLTHAMAAHPEMVAGEGRACTELMRAMEGRVAIKTGAEAVFVAIIPEKKIGIALKVEDGGTRAAEAAICALLVREGVLEREHPATRKWLDVDQTNCRGVTTGAFRTASGFPA